MSNDSPLKKYKRPKLRTATTTNPEAPKTVNNRDEDRSECAERVCPLLAKDSEWVDIMQTPIADAPETSSSNVVGDDEAVLQLVDCEDGPQSKPMAVMFPGLLNNPQTLEGIITKAMSTTEVTRNLVELGEKANFTYMKKANRLIPRDKKWLESVAEHSSLESDYYSSSFSSEYEADTEHVDEQNDSFVKRRKKKRKCRPRRVLLSMLERASSTGLDSDCQLQSSRIYTVPLTLETSQSQITEPPKEL